MTTPDTDHANPEGVPTPPPAPTPWYRKLWVFFLGLEDHWRVGLALIALVIVVTVILRLSDAVGGLFTLGRGPVTAVSGEVESTPSKLTYLDPSGHQVTLRKSPDASVKVTPLGDGKGAKIDPEDFGLVFDPHVGIEWAHDPLLPTVGARLAFIGPDLGVSALAEIPADLFHQTATRAGILLGPDLRSGNLDMIAGFHTPYAELGNWNFGVALAVFPFDPPGKTIVKKRETP